MVLWPLNRWRKSPETPLYFYILQENIKGTRKCSFCTQKCIFSCLRFGSFKNFSYLCSAKEIQQIPEKQPPLPHFRHPITLQLPSHRSTVVRRPSPSSLYSLQPYITRVLWLIDTKAPLSSRPREVALCLTAGLDLRKEDAINKYRPQRGRTATQKANSFIWFMVMCDIFEVVPSHIYTFRGSRPAVMYMWPLRGPCASSYIIPQKLMNN